MSKNENEARIYTGGRESARIFLRASSSHYTTIRMFGAVEKCGKQHMKGMQYQNKHVIKLSVQLQLEQPIYIYMPCLAKHTGCLYYSRASMRYLAKSHLNTCSAGI